MDRSGSVSEALQARQRQGCVGPGSGQGAPVDRGGSPPLLCRRPPATLPARAGYRGDARWIPVDPRSPQPALRPWGRYPGGADTGGSQRIATHQVRPAHHPPVSVGQISRERRRGSQRIAVPPSPPPTWPPPTRRGYRKGQAVDRGGSASSPRPIHHRASRPGGRYQGPGTGGSQRIPIPAPRRRLGHLRGGGADIVPLRARPSVRSAGAGADLPHPLRCSLPGSF